MREQLLQEVKLIKEKLLPLCEITKITASGVHYFLESEKDLIPSINSDFLNTLNLLDEQTLNKLQVKYCCKNYTWDKLYGKALWLDDTFDNLDTFIDIINKYETGNLRIVIAPIVDSQYSLYKPGVIWVYLRQKPKLNDKVSYQ